MPARGIHAIAAAEPDRTAIIQGDPSGDRRITYRELDVATNRAAHALASRGVAPGDRIAVMLENRPEVFVAWNAVARVGAHVVPVSHRSVAPELAYLLADSGAKGLVHENAAVAERAIHGLGGHAARAGVACLHIADRALREGPDTPPSGEFIATPVSWMAYTSGTTGRPKGIERPPPKPARDAPPSPYMEFWGFGANDVHLLSGPAYHTAPGAYAQMHLVEGAAVVILPRWDARECLRLIEAHRVTSSHMVPANFIRILELPTNTRARFDLSSIRKILHGAAACSVTVKRQIMAVFPNDSVWEYYGASEGMGTIISPAEWLERPGSVGKPFPGLDIRILDASGQELPPRQIGTIFLRPAPGFEPRYRNAPDKTREAYKGDLFTVGDLGWKDEDGYLYIADRRTDLILRGGVNVYPAEIESALAEHESVVDAAVIGLPDPRLGQRVHAIVELRPDASRDTTHLRAFLRERLADFKVPETIEITDALPREPNGKIKKRALRDERASADERTTLG